MSFLNEVNYKEIREKIFAENLNSIRTLIIESDYVNFDNNKNNSLNLDGKCIDKNINCIEEILDLLISFENEGIDDFRNNFCDNNYDIANNFINKYS
jgi:hypothetical protein